MAELALKSRGPTNNLESDAGFDRLVREARSNPQLFHGLVFDTERTIRDLEYLTPEEKTAITRIDPQDLAAGVSFKPSISDREVCGASCGASCGGSCAASCAGSCGGSCGLSCENSCAGTCGASCGASCTNSCAASCVTSCVVSGDAIGRGDLVSQPAETLTKQIAAQVKAQSIQIRFSRFQR